MTDVRAAGPEDRAGILALCAELHAENGQHAIDWPKVETMVDRCLSREGGCMGVVGPLGAPRGAVMLLLDPVWYSTEYQLLELFNFVSNDHRKSDYARSLIAYAKGCAEMIGVDLTIGVLSNERMEAKVRLYRRMLPKAGEFFVFRPTLTAADLPMAAE